MITFLLTNFAATCDHTFLGLVPWYKYLKLSPAPECDVQNFNIFPGNEPSDVPLILLAVVDDLLRIAGIVAVAFVIVGAIQYITSQGKPDETAKAQSTIVNALIGLVVSMVSVAFVTYIGARLKG